MVYIYVLDYPRPRMQSWQVKVYGPGFPKLKMRHPDGDEPSTLSEGSIQSYIPGAPMTSVLQG